jgi:hypothetical protein
VFATFTDALTVPLRDTVERFSCRFETSNVVLLSRCPNTNSGSQLGMSRFCELNFARLLHGRPVGVVVVDRQLPDPV